MNCSSDEDLPRELEWVGKQLSCTSRSIEANIYKNINITKLKRQKETIRTLMCSISCINIHINTQKTRKLLLKIRFSSIIVQTS